MGRRLRSRSSNGRFRRATLANTFGLLTVICADCRGFNVYQIGEDRPTTCKQCGVAPLRDLTEAPTETSHG